MAAAAPPPADSRIGSQPPFRFGCGSGLSGGAYLRGRLSGWRRGCSGWIRSTWREPCWASSTSALRSSATLAASRCRSSPLPQAYCGRTKQITRSKNSLSKLSTSTAYLPTPFIIFINPFHTHIHAMPYSIENPEKKHGHASIQSKILFAEKSKNMRHQLFTGNIIQFVISNQEWWKTLFHLKNVENHVKSVEKGGITLCIII